MWAISKCHLLTWVCAALISLADPMPSVTPQGNSVRKFWLWIFPVLKNGTLLLTGIWNLSLYLYFFHLSLVFLTAVCHTSQTLFHLLTKVLIAWPSGKLTFGSNLRFSPAYAKTSLFTWHGHGTILISHCLFCSWRLWALSSDSKCPCVGWGVLILFNLLCKCSGKKKKGDF